MDFAEIIRDARNKLEALPARPGVGAVAEAHHRIASIDRKVVESLEHLKMPTESGVSGEGDSESLKLLKVLKIRVPGH